MASIGILFLPNRDCYSQPPGLVAEDDRGSRSTPMSRAAAQAVHSPLDRNSLSYSDSVMACHMAFSFMQHLARQFRQMPLPSSAQEKWRMLPSACLLQNDLTLSTLMGMSASASSTSRRSIALGTIRSGQAPSSAASKASLISLEIDFWAQDAQSVSDEGQATLASNRPS